VSIICSPQKVVKNYMKEILKRKINMPTECDGQGVITMSEKKIKFVIGIKLIQICSLCRKYGSNRYVMQPFCTRQKLIKSNVEKMSTQCISEINMFNSVSAISGVQLSSSQVINKHGQGRHVSIGVSYLLCS
jgi:hypothetical protein